MGEKVVITGMGVVSPIGSTVDLFWDSLIHGRSGIGPVTHFDATNLAVKIAGEVRDFSIDKFVEPKEAKRLDRFLQYAIGASAEAVAQAGLDSLPESVKQDIGVIIGCGIGGIQTIESNVSVLLSRGPSRVSPFFVPMSIIDMAPGMVSMRYGFQGPNYAVSSACASGGHAFIECANLIRLGKAKIMVCGGTEAAVTPISLAGFHSSQALCASHNDNPTGASRPFDRNRDGFVMGEGAGILVLESESSAKARGATIYAEFAGYGMTGDAYHITAPRPDGSGAARAIRQALDDAKLTASDVDYINAHGTSTPLNDKTETLSIKSALGEAAYKVSISSTKSMTGHSLGASAAIESIAAILAIKNNLIPPTINFQEADPDCDLDITPNTARERKVDVAMKITLGFGGHNAALLFRRWNG